MPNDPSTRRDPAPGLPLRVGDAGPGVRDLHGRLDRAGFGCLDNGEFGTGTEESVRLFQQSRGLEPDGIVDIHTWSALAEAQHRPGDRLLYHRAPPMLRGDDVAVLQRRLGALGFDPGRVDGIFGPDTARALETFQRNAGLPADAICGPDTIAALQRLGGRDRQENVTEVRERDRLRRTRRPDADLHVIVGSLGGLGAVIDTIGRRLRQRGVRVEVLEHPDEGHHVQIANRIDADLYIGLLADDDARCDVAFFGTDGFESVGGALFAEILADEISGVVGVEGASMAQRRPLLRETRMPAVVARIGPPEVIVEHGPDLAAHIDNAITRWHESLAG